MHVLVCVPTARDVHGLTMASVFRTCAGFPGPISFQVFLAQPVDQCRNLCVRHFLEGTWSHLLFVDSDVVMPDDGLLNLLGVDAPIACGLYPLHLGEEGLCLSAAQRVGDDRFTFMPDTPAEPFEADACGLGCSLIRRDVLERIDQPWFRFGVGADGQQVGEDIDFFQRVRDQLGIRPVVVPQVLCGHHRVADLAAIWMDQGEPMAMNEAAAANAANTTATATAPTSPITPAEIADPTGVATPTTAAAG